MRVKRNNRLVDFILYTLTIPVMGSYYKIDYQGYGNIPKKGPALLLPKHQSYQDILIEGMFLKKADRYGNWVMKIGLPAVFEYIGGIGIMRAKDIIKTKSKDRRRERAQKARIIEGKAKDYTEWLYKNNEIIVVHPEGTRKKGKVGNIQRYMIDFTRDVQNRLGIDIAVIPLGIEYESAWKPGSKVWVRAGEPIEANTPDISEIVKLEIKRLSNL